MKLSKACQECIHVLNNHGFEAYVVGGAVRNFLLDIPIQDFDITTNALPQQIKSCFTNYMTIDIGIKHGTVAILIDHEQIEITTYRTEKEYTQHRYPSEVSFTKNLQEDCLRRDFTINALCYHPDVGIIDYVHGQDDLNHQTIRAIGDPIERFSEDALRILRAIRFCTQLGFVIEPITNDALFTCKHFLESISSERTMDELSKILLSPRCANQCFEYHEIIEIFIPELKQLLYYPIKRNKVYSALSNSYPSFPIRFAILIHQCNESDLLVNATQIMNRLKFSTVLKQQIFTLLFSLSVQLTTKQEIKHFLQSSKINFIDVCDFRSYIDTSFNSKEAQSLYHEIIQNNECYTLKQLAISGHDLKDLGYKDKEISTHLNILLNQVIDEQVQNTKEELLNAIKS